jgi:diguanylate cyclase (GGDEF)-like protein/PAS domain S-box-containing protein
VSHRTLRAGLHRARRLVVFAAVVLVLATSVTGWLFAQGEAEERRALEDRFTARRTTASQFLSAYVAQAVAKERADAQRPDGGGTPFDHETTLRSFVEHVVPFRSAEIFVIDRGGTVVASNQPAANGALWRRTRPGFAAISDHQGHARLDGHGHFVTQGPVEGTTWTLVFAVDETELLAPLNRSLASLLQWVGLGTFLLVGVCALALLHRSLLRGAQLAESEERHRRILDATSDAFIGVDAAGRVTDWNVAATRLLGWADHEARGQLLSELVLPQDKRSTHQAGFTDRLEEGHPAQAGQPHHVVLAHRDGSLLDVEMTLSPVTDSSGWLCYAFVRDISERVREQQTLEELALTDGLTGLANRRAAVDRLEQALAASRRHGAPVAVVYVDVDRFKPVNDRFGHKVGDAILRTVAERLRMTFRVEDTVARMGGDEFVVICENLGSANEPHSMVSRARSVLAQPYVVDGRRHELSASLGLAMSDGETSVERLLDHADAVMYEAKATRQAFAAVVKDL